MKKCSIYFGFVIFFLISYFSAILDFALVSILYFRSTTIDKQKQKNTTIFFISFIITDITHNQKIKQLCK
jgi:hypothetical protein